MIYTIDENNNKEIFPKIVQVTDECCDCEHTQEKEIINNVSDNASVKSFKDDPQAKKDQVKDTMPNVEEAADKDTMPIDEEADDKDTMPIVEELVNEDTVAIDKELVDE